MDLSNFSTLVSEICLYWHHVGDYLNHNRTVYIRIERGVVYEKVTSGSLRALSRLLLIATKLLEHQSGR